MKSSCWWLRILCNLPIPQAPTERKNLQGRGGEGLEGQFVLCYVGDEEDWGNDVSLWCKIIVIRSQIGLSQQNRAREYFIGDCNAKNAGGNHLRPPAHTAIAREFLKWQRFLSWPVERVMFTLHLSKNAKCRNDAKQWQTRWKKTFVPWLIADHAGVEFLVNPVKEAPVQIWTTVPGAPCVFYRAIAADGQHPVTRACETRKMLPRLVCWPDLRCHQGHWAAWLQREVCKMCSRWMAHSTGRLHRIHSSVSTKHLFHEVDAKVVRLTCSDEVQTTIEQQT